MKKVDLMRVAAIQMVSGADVAINLKTAEGLIKSAVDQGAHLVVLPEYFACLPENDRQRELATELGDGQGIIQQFLRQQAIMHGIYLVGGSLALRMVPKEKPYDCTLVFGPDGQLVAQYHKIHLFQFQTVTESYDEQLHFAAGTKPVVFETPWGRIGLLICYDIRFPEQIRLMNQKDTIDAVCVVAAFTHTTGRDHWDVLLRARAIENQCYIVASAQGGIHSNGRQTWGQSGILDPWGRWASKRDESGEGVVVWDLSHQVMSDIRDRLPALRHRRLL